VISDDRGLNEREGIDSATAKPRERHRIFALELTDTANQLSDEPAREPSIDRRSCSVQKRDVRWKTTVRAGGKWRNGTLPRSAFRGGERDVEQLDPRPPGLV
jgi:hypothetical protein